MDICFGLSYITTSWPCIYSWLSQHVANPACPVCRSAINQEKLIPVYGRGGSNKDPRANVPPRPNGQREEPNGRPQQLYGQNPFLPFPMAQQNIGGFQFQMGFGGFGLFPALFGMHFVVSY